MDTTSKVKSFKEVMTSNMYSPNWIANAIKTKALYVHRWMTEERRIPAIYRERLDVALNMKTPDSWYGDERLPHGKVEDLSDENLSLVLEMVKEEMAKRLVEKEKTLYSQQEELTKKMEELQQMKKTLDIRG